MNMQKTMSEFAAMVAFACFTASAAGLDGGAAALQAKLAEEVKSIAVRGGALPGNVIVAGDEAVPLAFGRDGNAKMPVAAATVLSEGRAVAVSHTAFFCSETADDPQNAAFLRHCLTWLSHGTTPRKVFIDARNADQRTAVEKALPGVEIEMVGGYSALAGLSGGAVFVTSPDSHSLNDASLLAAFVRRGGGAFCSVVGWGWHQITGMRFDTENPFNAAMGQCGVFTSNSTTEKCADGRYEIAKDGGLPGIVASDALRIIEGADAKLPADVSARCVRTLGELMEALPPNDSRWRPRLERLAGGATGAHIPSPGRPLSGNNPRERIGMIIHQKAWQANPERNWPAHPAAATYPGIPAADAPRVTRKIDIDLSVPLWHGTGLFAAAGEPLTVTLAEGAEKLGLRVRVGTTECNITSKGSWDRAPLVTVELPLNKRTTTFASPFGGPVYIAVPQYRSTPPKTTVTIGPACAAAWFVEGRDTPETWKKTLETCQAPFAEIENDVIALTVPLAEAKKYANPQEVLTFFRQVLANDAWLVARPVKRLFPERMCADVQLCAGYMHSGYPVMLPMHTTKHLLNIDTLRKGDVDEVWGFFHELGHNHQNYDWTFDGTVEVTVNFFSLYNMEKLCGKTARQTEKMGNANLLRSVERWKAAGRPFDKWKADPFLALDFFVGLQQRYGWESFRKFFAEYRTLKPEERPKTDADKRRQWCERFSRIVGEDLTSEFEFMLEPRPAQKQTGR